VKKDTGGRAIFQKAQYLTIRDFLCELDSPRSLAVWLLFSSNEHKQLVTLTIDPLNYDDPSEFRKDYAATKLLSKCSDLKTGIDTKQVALDAALKAESLCRETNLRLKSERYLGVNQGPNARIFHSARDTIERILGTCPSTLDEFKDVGWSPGRSSSCYGLEISSIHKYVGRLDVTPSAYGMARNLLNASPLWAQAALDADGPCSLLFGAFEFTEGNTMTVVPKNAKTDRTICYEPHLNIRLQLMVGSYLKSRLLKAGIDLSDQSINQRRAQYASRKGHLATLDLSMASDTVSVELVRELLPPDWYSLLDRLRCKETVWPDGVSRWNQKFSSMGNGFTFELESLLFYAICSAISPSGVSVYGDDIILPADRYLPAVEALENSGFILNRTKSFSTGWFRESCGMDAFRGLNVTPVYIRNLQKVTNWFLLIHNQIRVWVSGFPLYAYSRLLRRIRNRVPHHLGPPGQGDGHYHVNVDEAKPIRHRTWDGWLFYSDIYMFRVNSMYGDRVHGHYSGKFAIGALCASIGPKRPRSVFDLVTDRRLVVTKKKRIFSHKWEDIVWV
jgi:hypothetical protein